MVEKQACDKCNNTGFIPFINKEGKLIPHTFLFCDCHEDAPEYDFPFSPQDFDWAMSYSVYRSLCQQHGWQDPGPDILKELDEPKPQIIEYIYRTSDMSKAEFDLLQRTALKVKYLGDKLKEVSYSLEKKAERRASKQVKPQAQPLKGIET